MKQFFFELSPLNKYQHQQGTSPLDVAGEMSTECWVLPTCALDTVPALVLKDFPLLTILYLLCSSTFFYLLDCPLTFKYIEFLLPCKTTNGWMSSGKPPFTQFSSHFNHITLSYLVSENFLIATCCALDLRDCSITWSEVRWLLF
jgi:hypothetical protein